MRSLVACSTVLALLFFFFSQVVVRKFSRSPTHVFIAVFRQRTTASFPTRDLYTERGRKLPTTTAQENHISGSLFTSFWGALGFCFFALNFVNRKMIKCFPMKLNKYWEKFYGYFLVASTSLKKVFLRYNFSNNSVQVPSSMHSNVQLLYLLLFFAVVIGVAVLVA